MSAVRRISDASEHAASQKAFAILFASTPRGARLARLLTVQWLDSWGIPYDSEDSHTLAMLVAELSANAALHGHIHGRDFRVSVRLAQPIVRIRVFDTRTDSIPAFRKPGPDSFSGRGLVLVDMLSDRWGVDIGQAGKTVWCEYRLSRAVG